MKCNVGRTDRIIRVIIGLAIIWAGFYYESWWGVIGVIPLATGAFAYCPTYIPFKFSTCLCFTHNYPPAIRVKVRFVQGANLIAP